MTTGAQPQSSLDPSCRAGPAADRWGLPVLFACVAVVLVANLGSLPIRGSEGRWTVIGRYNMYRSGDLFTPQIGPHQSYWDKPLLSYWQMLPGAWVRGGVDEFSARLPSALWALVLFLLTYDLTRRWFDRQTAWVRVEGGRKWAAFVPKPDWPPASLTTTKTPPARQEPLPPPEP